MSKNFTFGREFLSTDSQHLREEQLAGKLATMTDAEFMEVARREGEFVTSILAISICAEMQVRQFQALERNTAALLQIANRKSPVENS